jgi:hypothetical protein
MENENDSKLLESVQTHLKSGGIIMLSTYTKSTQYTGAKFIEYFKLGRDGHILVKRGKHWDDAHYCKFTAYVYKKEN